MYCVSHIASTIHVSKNANNSTSEIPFWLSSEQLWGMRRENAIHLAKRKTFFSLSLLLQSDFVRKPSSKELSAGLKRQRGNASKQNIMKRIALTLHWHSPVSGRERKESFPTRFFNAVFRVFSHSNFRVSCSRFFSSYCWTARRKKNISVLAFRN